MAVLQREDLRYQLIFTLAEKSSLKRVKHLFRPIKRLLCRA